MNNHRGGFLIAVFLGLALTLPVRASQPLPAYTVHIIINNQSANGVWMTAYKREFKDVIVRAWCVHPNQNRNEMFGKGQGPYKVIAEIKSQTNCHGHTQFYFNKTITGRDSGANW